MVVQPNRISVQQRRMCVEKSNQIVRTRQFAGEMLMDQPSFNGPADQTNTTDAAYNIKSACPSPNVAGANNKSKWTTRIFTWSDALVN